MLSSHSTHSAQVRRLLADRKGIQYHGLQRMALCQHRTYLKQSVLFQSNIGQRSLGRWPPIGNKLIKSTKADNERGPEFDMKSERNQTTPAEMQGFFARPHAETNIDPETLNGHEKAQLTLLRKLLFFGNLCRALRAFSSACGIDKQSVIRHQDP